MDLLNGPTDKQLKVIKDELNEDDDRFNHNLDLLKSWFAMQDHLPKNYDSNILSIFLRGCKHDLEKTKRKLQYFYAVKTTAPEIFSNRDTTCKEFITTSKIMALLCLKNLNFDGTRVMVCRLMSSDASLFNIESVVRLFFMIGDLRVREEFPISGDIIIMDCGNNLTATHVAKCANFIVGKSLTIANEAYPQRVKRIHVLNLPDVGEKLVTFIKSFMKEKIRNRFLIHRKPEELSEYISNDILPVEYGGKGTDLATLHDQWNQYFTEKNDWFKEQEKLTALPIPKHLLQSCALDSNECLQGSFRKLAID